jgi:methionyl-tRNA formyltransferase
MRLSFAGTPEFAAVALDALHAAGHEIVLVLTQPDRPAGRGMQLQPSAVKQRALALGLPLAQPRGLRLDGRWPQDAQSAQAALQAARAEMMVVAAYGLILPRWVLGLPARGCLNIHASLLPRWRGAAPIHRAIEAGDARTGVTLMQMDEGLDTGDMLLRAEEAILPDDNTARLHDRLAALGARLVVQALAQVDTLVREPQPVQGVSYARKVEKAEATVDWREPAAVIERRVRAFDPFPGAHFGCADEQIKLWRAEIPARQAGVAAAPGTVLETGAQGLLVVCGDGVLACLEVQRPGGRRQEAAQWLRSPAGAWLRPGVVLPLPLPQLQPSVVPAASTFKAAAPPTDNPRV